MIIGLSLVPPGRDFARITASLGLQDWEIIIEIITDGNDVIL